MADTKKSFKGKRLITGIALGLVLLLAGGYLVTLMSPSQGPAYIESKIKDMGKDFYENFYFDTVTDGNSEADNEAFFANFSETGIKINIENLARYDGEKYKTTVESFKNKKEDVACDPNNTRAIIYPKSPYGKKDYDIVAELDCGFETTKTE